MTRKSKSRLASVAVGALAALMLSPMAALAEDSFLGSYVAYLGPNDHFNSSGVRLTEPWQIVQQDRANVHRFGKVDEGDMSDPWFGSADMRAKIQSLTSAGLIHDFVSSPVVNENVWVEVAVFGSNGKVTRIEVWPPG